MLERYTGWQTRGRESGFTTHFTIQHFRTHRCHVTPWSKCPRWSEEHAGAINTDWRGARPEGAPKALAEGVVLPWPITKPLPAGVAPEGPAARPVLANAVALAVFANAGPEATVPAELPPKEKPPPPPAGVAAVADEANALALLAPNALPLLALAPAPAPNAEGAGALAPKAVPVPNAEVVGALAPPAPKPAPAPPPKEKAGADVVPADVLPAPGVGALLLLLLPNADGIALVVAELPVALAAAPNEKPDEPPPAPDADALSLPPTEKPVEEAAAAGATPNPADAADEAAVGGALLRASGGTVAPVSAPLLLPNEKAPGVCAAVADENASVLAAGALAALALPDVDTPKLEPVDAPVLALVAVAPNENPAEGLSFAAGAAAAALALAPALLAEPPNEKPAPGGAASLAAELPILKPPAGAAAASFGADPGAGAFSLPLPSPCAADAALEPNERAGALSAAASPVACTLDTWGAGVGAGGGLGGEK